MGKGEYLVGGTVCAGCSNGEQEGLGRREAKQEEGGVGGLL